MKKLALLIYFSFSIFFFQYLNAQEFYICDSNGNLGKVNLKDCSYKAIPLIKTVAFFTDITFHPNGKLYGCASGSLYEIDTLPNSRPRLVASSNFAGSTSLTADKNGIIYGADTELWSYNPATNQYKRHGPMKAGNQPVYAGGDLTFYNGNLYVASDKNQIVELNIDQPTASSIAFTIPSKDTIFGIMSSKDCDKVRTYVTNNRANSDIFEINWLSKTTSYVCTIPVRVYGAASRYEFLASKPDTTLVESLTCDPTQAKTTTQTLKNSLNCDSLVTTKIIYVKPNTTTLSKTLCDGDSLLFGNKYFKQNGTYALTLQSQWGCDSLISLTLNVLKKDTVSLNKITCNPQKVGILKELLKNKQGCDSLVFTNFSLKNAVNFSQKISLCEGLSLSVGDTSLKTTGIYVKTLKTSEGCDSTLTTYLTVTSLNLKMPQDTFINLGDSIRLTAFTQATNPLKLKWTPSESVHCDTCFSTWARPLSPTAYRLSLYDTLSKCRKDGTVIIRIKTDCAVFVPSAFSPNGDGSNDKLMVYLDSKCIKKIKRYAIFNRWGDLMAESHTESPDFPREWELWDGLLGAKTADNAVYAYLIEVEYINGQTQVLAGDVTLMR
jgi:gliding motility-associated-like protein